MGDIAIDDVSFSNYFTPCSYIPVSTAPSTPPPTTITPADSNCTFDSNNLCRWKNYQGNDIDWSVTYTDRRSGTGPFDDHTKGLVAFHFCLYLLQSVSNALGDKQFQLIRSSRYCAETTHMRTLLTVKT